MMSSSTPSTSEELSFSILSAMDETSEKNSETWQTVHTQQVHKRVSHPVSSLEQGAGGGAGAKAGGARLESWSSLAAT